MHHSGSETNSVQARIRDCFRLHNSVVGQVASLYIYISSRPPASAGEVRLGSKCEGLEPSRHVSFTADRGSADRAFGVYEFMTLGRQLAEYIDEAVDVG